MQAQQDTTTDSDSGTDMEQRTKQGRRSHAGQTAKQAFLAVTAVMALAFLGQHAAGWFQDRLEDRRPEDPETSQRRLMIRWLRNSLPWHELAEWLDHGLLGGNMRLLFLPAYSLIFERELRRAIPGGPTVWRREIIYVQGAAGWQHVSAVLDPFLNSFGLTITPAMANTLGVHHGQTVTYSIAGHEFIGAITVQVPIQADAIQQAQQEATAANRELTPQQAARRAAEIIAERQRCVVVHAAVLQQLLRAHVTINMS
ncbi:citrate synthase 2 [Chlorella sorokiniana]|uniref:Citrate synthase 2 n=1 Tax=Chlorella sorokiniana TaxID=3076 RepID=A0A2P6TDK0_CHLSO|nr:citrate synthase 2 [Chlorella sorokiniana]|eukprot:PRW20707.1 citrate synthase 2 [Chlorella sorokiniana]